MLNRRLLALGGVQECGYTNVFGQVWVSVCVLVF
jgi:hypothetical protein